MTALSLLLPYLAYSFVMTGTPGPNNMMALASGVRVGWWRTMPLVLGIAVGVAAQLALLALGLAPVMQAEPLVHTGLQIAGSGFLLYIAFKIATAGPIEDDPEKAAKPLGFVGGAMFQWINPKCWAMTMSAVALYVPANPGWLDVLIACTVLACTGILMVSTWAAGGSLLRRWLVRPKVARLFNGVMAALLLASCVPLLLDGSFAVDPASNDPKPAAARSPS